jgi:PGF-CTERM protein
MYDVNFGGIEIMTKRFTIALVALALFVLVAVMPVAADYYSVAPNINQGATVFIGEQGLDLTQAVITARTGSSAPTSTIIGWWASAAVVTTTSPTKSIDVAARVTSFTVTPADFVGYGGNWYLVDNLGTGFAAVKGTAPNLVPVIVIAAADPTLDLRIWDATQASDVTGKSVPQGENLTFRIDTNMYQALTTGPNGRFPVTNMVGNVKSTQTNQTGFGDGYIDIKVKDESGATLTALYNGSANNLIGGISGANGITAQNVSTSGWFWGSIVPAMNTPGPIKIWNTGTIDSNGQNAYPAGTYTVWAESLLNNMKDTYRNAGADYTGKTVSQTYTVTLVSDTVKIEANKDSVVRSKPFSVTVTGKPSTTYHVWVKGTSTMSGTYDDQPPMIGANQAGVVKENPFLVGLGVVEPLNGGYVFQNSGGLRIIDDVATGAGTAATVALGNGTNEYANVTLSTSGTRTVEFITTNWTKAQKYTIRVEQTFGTQVKSDEVDVNVEKGAVTIVAAGDQSYYLGEEIKFSGTNTETTTTYLFIIGPNLVTTGSQIQSADPRNFPVLDQQPNTFQTADVLGDNTWSWKWGTSNVALDAGTYTVYAVSGPRIKTQSALATVAYGTVSIIIKKPFVSATASQSTVAQGDRVFITGTAEGNPSKGVQIWILGKNFVVKAAQSVNSDASFTYEVKKETTAGMYAGQYFVVVQHPMQNNIFDVDAEHATGMIGIGTGVSDNYVVNKQLQGKNQSGTIVSTNSRIFKLEGPGSLQGSDAAEALVEGINDANVDDTYTKLQFLVEVPVIRVDPIGDKHVGDKFTITATTNLAVDDEVLVEVYSSSFKPTQKSQSGEFSGATGTVKVTKGDSGLNKISFDIDSSTFKPDEYLVQENAVLQQATGTALFNVLEGAAPTVAPTVVVTTVAPTAVQTTVVATTVPVTPTPTKSPGYGALIALIGLGAVAFIVVRRH